MMEGKSHDILTKDYSTMQFFFSQSILSGTDFVVVLHIFNASANDTYLL